MGEFLSPHQIWKNFDSVAESLDAKLIKSEARGKIKIEYHYFTGRHLSAGASRVYCTAAWEKENSPALLLVGDISRPVDTELLVYWAQKGFTAVAIDYAGDLGLGAHTVYPEPIGYANYQKAGRRLTHADTDAKETAWFEYSLNTMRAVTFITENTPADKKDISLVSIGGSSVIACHCLAFDKRIRTACIVYGKIWQDFSERQEPDEGGTADSDARERWLAGICPQSYIPFIEQPVYVVAGTNSTETDLEDTGHAVKRFPNKNSRCFFVPGMPDTVTDEISASVKAWIDATKQTQKTPKPPTVKVESGEGRLFAKASGEGEISVWYARGIKNKKLNWVCPEITPKGAAIEVYDENLPVTVFANARAEGLVISGEAAEFLPKEIDKKPELTEYTRMVYNYTMGKGDFIPVDASLPKPAWSGEVFFKTGPLGITGVGGKKFGTFVICENKVLRHFESVLIIDLYSKVKQDIDIIILQHWFGEQAKFTAHVSLMGGEIWQKLVLSGQEFRSPMGRTLSAESMDGLDLMAFSCESEIVVTSILFT